jgi:tRNA dimethylallyltransferase
MTGRIWLIAGPTASGKSALALRLAAATGAEIVNADSMQIYADLRLLTARPSPEEEARAPHHLFGVADAADGDLAGADYGRLGETAFRERLAIHDPAAAQRIEVGDRQRLIRAWAVYAATGTALSEWRGTGQPLLPAEAWRGVALEPPRDALYARCDARLAAMVEAGALDEVRALAARGLDPALPALKAVGYRELAAFLRGETTLDAALAAAQMQTRRYAKRQATWMRGQMADWPRLTQIDPAAQWRQFIALRPDLTLP